MPDQFLASNFDIPLSAPVAGPLLAWAQGVEQAALPADIYRQKEGRTTLRFEHNSRAYFLKRHTGVGWREILKNVLTLRLPVIGATNEFRALVKLRQMGLYTLEIAAYADAGLNPARRQSMIVTVELAGTVSLEDYCVDWQNAPPPFATRLRIIRLLAGIARSLHDAGINHRDFYLCHFHIEEESLTTQEPRCYLIDLHRAQLHNRLPDRWREKDLAGLYFSAMDCGLTERDLLRFMRHYERGGLRQATGKYSARWRRVASRARKMYGRDRGIAAPLQEPLQ
jgi:heptose I phosphotransferase